ncbi:hypothetical protein B6U93_02805 [Candidatus Woesearchaeota archaeon ex4484_78]|nr:MAG: hypothetical protein B6U93_02805 [Candidatus Woesearchaeota archaeon ex4484_78]
MLNNFLKYRTIAIVLISLIFLSLIAVAQINEEEYFVFKKPQKKESKKAKIQKTIQEKSREEKDGTNLKKILEKGLKQSLNESLLSEIDRKIKVIDSRGFSLDAKKQITKRTKNTIDLELNLKHYTTIRKIKIKNLKKQKTYKLRIGAETGDANLFVNTFLIDLANLDMTEANITFKATGNSLLKCTDFDATTLKCNGVYAPVLTGMTPGQEYTFTLNKTDPLFGETIQGPANISDSTIISFFPNTNFGNFASIPIGTFLKKNPMRGLIKFNLSSIPSKARIISANLSLYFFYSTVGGSRTHAVHRVQQFPARNWIETQVTWNSYNGTDSWTIPGGDYNTTPTDTQTFDNSALNSWITYNVTTDVQNFINNHTLNFGWIIKDTDETTQRAIRAYASSENNNPAKRPKLQISYITQCNPTLNQDWIITTAEVCDNVERTTGTGKIIIKPSGSLTLINAANISTNGLEINRTGDSVFINKDCKLIVN